MTSEFELSEDQVREFEERGYLILDFHFDPQLLDAIVTKVQPLYDQEQLSQRHPGTRVQDGWLQVDEIRQLAVHANVLSALEQLYSRKPLPFQTLNFPLGTSQWAHSDTIHFNSIPSGYMAGVWVALEDIDEENGALIYYPGSHKLQEYCMQDFGLKPTYDDYPEYEQKIQEIIARENLSSEPGVMKKGMALIWAANLLHGGMPQKDPARTRHSQVTHYYFDACKYYTPMASKRQRKHYRKPVWIPDTPDFKLSPPPLRPTRWYARVAHKLGLLK